MLAPAVDDQPVGVGDRITRAQHPLPAGEERVELPQQFPSILAPGSLQVRVGGFIVGEASRANDVGEGRMHGVRQVGHVREAARHVDRLFRQQPGLRKAAGDVGQDRDVLGQHPVVGAQRRYFAARIDVQIL